MTPERLPRIAFYKVTTLVHSLREACATPNPETEL